MTKEFLVRVVRGLSYGNLPKTAANLRYSCFETVPLGAVFGTVADTAGDAAVVREKKKKK